MDLITAPVRTGIMGKLAQLLPQPGGENLFRPDFLSINITSSCVASCEHCCESHNSGRYEPMSTAEVSDILRQAADQIPPAQRRIFHIWGGEPFLDTNKLFAAVHEADKYGFSAIRITTNGFWGKDRKGAKDILQWLSGSTTKTEIILEISCDNMHNDQDQLKVEYLANITSLTEESFRGRISYDINSLWLSDRKSLRDLAKAMSRVDPFGRDIKFGESPSGMEAMLLAVNEDEELEWMRHIVFILPSVKRYEPGMDKYFGMRTLNPEDMKWAMRPINYHQAVIGIDRQFYINLHFCSIGALRMGSIREYSMAQLMGRVDVDPVAVSLMKCGYSEIYPQLKAISRGTHGSFDVDRWLTQFYDYADMLQGLESDEPVLALHPTKRRKAA